MLQDPDAWDGVLRSKGFFWLATRMDLRGLWSQAGLSASASVAGWWRAALPPEVHLQVPAEPGVTWDPRWGDRRQELVFIGVDLEEDALRAGLDAALLTPTELAAGPTTWAAFEDPFPAWTEASEDDDDDDDGAPAVGGAA